MLSAGPCSKGPGDLVQIPRRHRGFKSSNPCARWSCIWVSIPSTEAAPLYQTRAVQTKRRLCMQHGYQKQLVQKNLRGLPPLSFQASGSPKLKEPQGARRHLGPILGWPTTCRACAPGSHPLLCGFELFCLEDVCCNKRVPGFLTATHWSGGQRLMCRHPVSTLKPRIIT